ncbi:MULTISPECIES: hypothetical protein [Streptomyces]|uniref:hypothetical protein n=1 Tax=Streptomyces TaxID=1883 RepID=UPI0006916D80|nr:MULTISPECIES: hypothetical protein [Streptomyces]
MRITHAAALGLALLAATGCSSGSGKAGPAPTVTVTVTATPVLTHDQILEATAEILASASANSAPSSSPAPSGPATTISPGTYLVGEDIKAGSYKTAGPSSSSVPNCYWSRARNDSGELSAIIANELLPGPGRVTVKAGEIFETSGCEAWQIAG